MKSAKLGVFAWIRRVTKSLSGEAQDLADLNVQLRQALERGLIDADALQMLEGVLEVPTIKHLNNYYNSICDNWDNNVNS